MKKRYFTFGLLEMEFDIPESKRDLIYNLTHPHPIGLTMVIIGFGLLLWGIFL